MRKGKARVYIGKYHYRLDTLVAKHFLSGYRTNDILEHLDGNQKNCGAWNLRIVPRSDFAKKHSRNKRSRPVILDGKRYPSIATCAKALFLDESTVQKYLKGTITRTGRWTLDGHDIRYADPEPNDNREENDK